MTSFPENSGPETSPDSAESASPVAATAVPVPPKVKVKPLPPLAEIPVFTPAPRASVPIEAPGSGEPPAPVVPPPVVASSEEFRASLVEECQVAIGYRFQNDEVLRQALTHSSIANVRLESNERLEFLGDSIMGTVICEYLFRTYPTCEEGELTRIKSAVVSRHTCAKTAFSLRLNQFMFLGKGLAVHERIPNSIMAAAFEALVASIFLDGGWEAAREFVVRILREDIQEVAGTAHGENYKSQLQQLSQKVFSQTPTYKLLDEKGPDHAKCFLVAAAIGSRTFPPAWGASKKEAEQSAAQNSLAVIEQGPETDLDAPVVEAADSGSVAGLSDRFCESAVLASAVAVPLPESGSLETQTVEATDDWPE